MSLGSIWRRLRPQVYGSSRIRRSAAAREGDARYKFIAACPDFRTRLPTQPHIERLVHALEHRGVRIVVSAERMDRVDAGLSRLGLTAPHTTLPPVVWLNVARHGYAPGGTPDPMELLDTLAHEGVHAVAALLGEALPNPEAPEQERNLAELCAHYGSGIVLRRLGDVPGARRNEWMAQHYLDKCAEATTARRAVQIGAQAAEILLSVSGLDILGA